jgi:hypothetical protein
MPRTFARNAGVRITRFRRSSGGTESCDRGDAPAGRDDREWRGGDPPRRHRSLVATHVGAPLAAPALIVAAGFATAIHAAVRRTRPRLSRGSCLRHCPWCGGNAVDWWSREEIDGSRERIALHCASCSVSRCLFATVRAVDAYEHRYPKDRDAIGSALCRAERQRLRRETKCVPRDSGARSRWRRRLRGRDTALPDAARPVSACCSRPRRTRPSRGASSCSPANARSTRTLRSCCGCSSTSRSGRSRRS